MKLGDLLGRKTPDAARADLARAETALSQAEETYADKGSDAAWRTVVQARETRDRAEAALRGIERREARAAEEKAQRERAAMERELEGILRATSHDALAKSAGPIGERMAKALEALDAAIREAEALADSTVGQRRRASQIRAALGITDDGPGGAVRVSDHADATATIRSATGAKLRAKFGEGDFFSTNERVAEWARIPALLDDDCGGALPPKGRKARSSRWLRRGHTSTRASGFSWLRRLGALRSVATSRATARRGRRYTSRAHALDTVSLSRCEGH